MFDRAAITLGIGPHSSFYVTLMNDHEGCDILKTLLCQYFHKKPLLSPLSTFLFLDLLKPNIFNLSA